MNGKDTDKEQLNITSGFPFKDNLFFFFYIIPKIAKLQTVPHVAFGFCLPNSDIKICITNKRLHFMQMNITGLFYTNGNPNMFLKKKIKTTQK